MRISRPGEILFAMVLIGLGGWALAHGARSGEFAAFWDGAPRAMPGRGLLGIATAALTLVCGLGLFVRRFAALAAGLLALALILWIALIRVPAAIAHPLEQGPWSNMGETAVLVSAALALHSVRKAQAAAGLSLPLSPATGLQAARGAYGLALIPFATAHFYYLKETAALVPAWLPAHEVWAAFTGCAYFAAAAAILTGVGARLAVVLSAVQMGSFLLLVWAPIIAAGATSAFVWSETLLSLALTAAAWVLAETWPGGWGWRPSRRGAEA